MKNNLYKFDIGTLINHYTEFENPENAHIPPIYQTATFTFPDTTTGQAIENGELPGYIYTRVSNPNLDQLAKKYALLEAIDLLKLNPGKNIEKIAAGLVFPSGMAAITIAILAHVHNGQEILVQKALYSNTYKLLKDIAPDFGIKVHMLDRTEPEKWRAVLAENPGIRLVIAESPVNPTMRVIDLQALSDICHHSNAWLMVDNTFATPFCQRPLSLGADIVIHSTTKYLSGHGVVTGGVAVSPHIDFIENQVREKQIYLGSAVSPFEAWLANLGLKTFELRMQRHCENAQSLAEYLENHPKISRVLYPGLKSHPQHEIARKQMLGFGGMLGFEAAGGVQACLDLIDNLEIATLAVSLGNVDTLIQHPASMTHINVPREERLATGLHDNLIRLSVGIENIRDLIADFEQALEKI